MHYPQYQYCLPLLFTSGSLPIGLCVRAHVFTALTLRFLWACLKDWGEDSVGVSVEDDVLDSLSGFSSSKSLLSISDNSDWASELLSESITIDCEREGGIVLDCRWYLGGVVEYIIERKHLWASLKNFILAYISERTV